MLNPTEQAEIFKRVKALARLYVKRYKYNKEQKRAGDPVWDYRIVPKAEEDFKDFLKEVG